MLTAIEGMINVSVGLSALCMLGTISVDVFLLLA